MSAGIKKPNSIELLEDLKAIIQINERINSLDVVRLKELLIFVKKTKIERFKFINEFLILNPTYTFDYAVNYITQYGLSYNDLEYLKDLIQKRIEYLTLETTNKKETINFYNPIFENIESKLFFEYLIKEWFNTLTKPKSAISFVFYIMSTNDHELPVKSQGLKYIIKDVKQLDFAYYWNDNYKEVHKHNYEIKINLKTARLKTFNEIPYETYIDKLNWFVQKFEKLK